jgi:predicted GIY-YIG superfamily endonuclease
MPWQGSERFDYDLTSSQLNTPTAWGVYVTRARGTWVYIGESGNLLSRLLQHLNGENPCLAQHRPTHFAFALVPADTRRTRQQKLIQRFQPVCS